jgi:hypothetical protein
MGAVRIVVACLVLGSACGDGGGAPIDAPVDVTLIPGGVAELGTGTTAFEPLAPDQELGLVAGPQGGYHFIVHSRIREMTPGDYTQPGLPENPVTLFEVFSSDDRQIDKMYPPYHIGYMADASDPTLYVLPSGRILQIENAEVPAIYGTSVKIKVRVSDADGRVATDERTVTVVPYEGI